MVRFRSTTGDERSLASFREALFRGQAPDGGLYVPDVVPLFDAARLKGSSFVARARAALGAWLDAEIGAKATAALCQEAFDFPVPLTRIDDGTWLLELFHGPTGAFKDFGARFMARALWRLRDAGHPVTVLVATSGDTGSAVAHAFGSLSDVRVVLLYPANRISPLQEAQLTSAPGHVQALRVAGTFDDCQRMVKAAFRDSALARDLGLTSANSINVGRLLPQISYYVHASLELGETLGDMAPSPDLTAPLVVVPSGNLGNLTAGLWAKRSGAPIACLLAASNRNDVFPRYLETGELEPRAAVATLSNAMDVGDPSNAARILALHDRDAEALRGEVVGESISDPETLRTIRDTYVASGRIVCPHTAVGLAARKRHARFRPAVVFATAHPGKFAEIAREATGEDVALPEVLRRALGQRRDPVDMQPEPAALQEFLRTLA
jgi:threonine synthase